MSYQMLIPINHPDFLCKCQIQPNSQDQRQFANLILEFKPRDIVLFMKKTLRKLMVHARVTLHQDFFLSLLTINDTSYQT